MAIQQEGGQDGLARGLGWFSIGLGLVGVASPDSLARLIGVQESNGHRTFLRAVGIREIASGVGILMQPQPTPWLWSRVAGDLMDLSYLGWAVARGKAEEPGRTAATLASVAGVTLMDVSTSLSLSSGSTNGRPDQGGQHVRKAVTINRPIEEVYRFWRDFENLPRFMSNLESVRNTGERRSHWVAQAPMGKAVEWDAELVEDRPNELIAWRSLPGASIDNAGQVRFRPAPGGRGTEVEVELQFAPPGGTLGRTVAKLFGKDPAQEIESDLRRFKQVMETGEIVRSEGTLGGTQLPQRPAQPPAGIPRYATRGTAA
jgi:uncharacterized membrane protein